MDGRVRERPAKAVSHRASRGELLGNLLSFGRLLRAHGIDVTAGRLIDAVRSVDIIDIGSREDFRCALRANFVSRREDLAKFDAAFDVFWALASEEEQESQGAGEEEDYLGDDSDGETVERQRLVAVENSDSQSEVETSPDEGLPAYSPDEVLAVKDFSDFTADDLQEVRRLIANLVPKITTVASRRTQPDPRGQAIDLRRSIRRSLKFGGEMVELSRKKPKLRKLRLVLLCDVSGSMDMYSRLLIQFMYVLQSELRGVETVVFSTRMSRVTHLFRSRALDDALDEISRTVKHWSGGTSIGESVRTFNQGLGRRLPPSRTVIIVVSDGWDQGDPALLEREMQVLKRNSYRIIWLNPLLGTPGYQPLCRGMKAALPYVDFFLPAHNLASLMNLARTLKRIARS